MKKYPALWRLAPLGPTVLVAVSILGGCANTSLSSMLSAPEFTKAAPAPAGQKIITVTLAPINGPPAAFSEALIRELNHATWERKIALLVDSNQQADYVLRGNFIASNTSGNQVSLAYNWDILDKSGNRVGRAADEIMSEAFPSRATPWTNISAAAIKSVADKAAIALASQVKPAT